MIEANWEVIYQRMTGRDRRDEDPILGALRRRDREAVARHHAEEAARQAAEETPETSPESA
ncbi:hypothetical protein GA0070622_5302 [Micromonospora sediminicola]|uniref:Uncharacterized protein n=1 Tax=Micromonospora sediminicola TaxID=946078 RepID=A0A1A9BGK3_9ACTN|nr:hypothetical protein [Micromonospora sediminicola]SBT68206.1 hypothetical protein GA0070622_5302 [Micromonospora sediminicola]